MDIATCREYTHDTVANKILKETLWQDPHMRDFIDHWNEVGASPAPVQFSCISKVREIV
jgi:hypothetical protein